MVSFMVKADTGWRYDVAAIACDYLSGFYQSGAPGLSFGLGVPVWAVRQFIRP
jgi:hypothetical protein